MSYWSCLVDDDSGMMSGPYEGSSEGREYWHYGGDGQHWYKAPTEQSAKQALKDELERRIDGLNSSLLEYCK